MRPKSDPVNPNTDYLFAKELGDRLRQIRGRRSQADFARDLGVAINSIGRYERGENLPDADFLRRLYKVIGTEPGVLLGLESPQGPESVIATGRQFAISANNLQFDPSRFDLVAFRDIAVSAGAGAEVLAETPTAWRLYPREYVGRRGLMANMLEEFSVRGDSMLPELGPGDAVLVDRRVTQIGPEDMYVVRVESALHVKYARVEKDRWVLRSLNPAYSEIDIRRDEYGSLAVIGRVVRILRDR